MTDRKRKLRIGIFGAAVEEIDKNTLKYAKILGKLLAKRDCEVVTGMAIGISHRVLLESRKNGAFTKGFSPDKNAIEHNERFDNAPIQDFDKVIFSKGFTRRSLKLIEYCDALIILGGRMGTLSEYTIAYEEEKPIAVLTNSGGIAQHLKKITKLCNKKRNHPIFFYENILILEDHLFSYLKSIKKSSYDGNNSLRYYILDKQSQQLKIIAENVMRDLIKKQRFNSLLDIGSGNGHFLRNFLKKDVRGIEISERMIANARDLKQYLIREDISNISLVSRIKKKYDIISSNYVFSELNSDKLKVAFKNVFGLLTKKGKFYFTINHPKTRHLPFSFHKVSFEKPFIYNKNDIPFRVLLKNSKGKFEDVGIRDYHNPIETYVMLLKEVGFKEIITKEVMGKNQPPHALLFICKKF